MTQADLWMLVTWGIVLGVLGAWFAFALIETAWVVAGIVCALIAVTTFGAIKGVRAVEEWVR